MQKTGIFCTAIMIIVGVYDAIVVMRHGVGCSVSQWVQEIGFSSPLFSMMIGALLGHFFMYMPPRWYKQDKLIDKLSKRLVELGEIEIKDKKVIWIKNNTKGKYNVD